MKRLILGLVAGFAMVSAAWAADPVKYVDTSVGKVMADMNGMVLYIWDKDTKGAAKSACVDKCIAAWPPFIAPAGAKPEGKFTIVDGLDKDGKTPVKMWAYDGWPLYYYVKDTKPMEATGDMVGTTWHVVKAM
jgi:predicted lipoprotein with Yx(FWY)xxD motif